MVQLSNNGSIAVPTHPGRRAHIRQREILRAAGRIFREKGFAAAGMREIAAEAGLSPGNLYHYFSGKEDLLYYCQNATLDRLLEHLQAAKKSADPIEIKLQTLLMAHVMELLGDFEGGLAHLELEAIDSKRRRLIVEKRDTYERGIRAFIRRGSRSGVFHKGDDTLRTRAILGALNWTTRWFRNDGKQSPKTVAKNTVSFLMQGLTSKESQS